MFHLQSRSLSWSVEKGLAGYMMALGANEWASTQKDPNREDWREDTKIDVARRIWEWGRIHREKVILFAHCASFQVDSGETNGQLGVEQSERAVPPIHCRQGIGIQNYRRQGDIVGRENSLEAELGLGPRLVAVPQIQMMVIQELKRGHAN
jgi:hypothetical protein